jgi:hypothetical protein
VAITSAPNYAIRDLVAAALKQYLMRSAVPVVELLSTHLSLAELGLLHVPLTAPTEELVAILKLNINVTTTANLVPIAHS